MIRGAQAKMHAGIIAAAVAVAGIQESRERSPARPHGDFGSIGVAALVRHAGANRQPVSAGRRHISKQAGRPGDFGDQQIRRAVVVKVRHHETPPNPAIRTEGRVCFRDIAKLALAKILKKLIPLGVSGPKGLIHFGVAVAANGAIDIGQIGPTVAIEIDKRGPEPGAS